MSETLRLMTAADIVSALRLSTEAGWNQTADDWKMLLNLAPDSCFAIEVDGTLAATTTLLCYGSKLAWIGMVLTTHQYRGRGFARRLLEEALTHADRRKIASVKLDATNQGRPLYETMGFSFEQAIERWVKTGDRTLPSNPQSGWQDDQEIFGADRSPLLSGLANRNRRSPCRNRSYSRVQADRPIISVRVSVTLLKTPVRWPSARCNPVLGFGTCFPTTKMPWPSPKTWASRLNATSRVWCAEKIYVVKKTRSTPPQGSNSDNDKR